MVILRIFHEKMDPNSADIEFFFFQLARFVWQVPGW
jgi:hypothetical protein